MQRRSQGAGVLAGKAQPEQRGGEYQERMLAFALMPYVAWALCVRCSPMLFAGATSTRPSYLFLVGLTLGAALLAIAWRLRATRPGKEEGLFPLQSAWGVGCLCASVGTLACLTPWFAGLPTVGSALLVGVLAGISYGIALVCAVGLCRRIGNLVYIRMMAWALAGALIVLVVLCLLVPIRWLALAGTLPLMSWLGVRRWVKGRPAGQMALTYSNALPIPRGRLAALLACVGFFAAFVVGMHPKSAHLPWLVENVTYVGALSSRSLIYLLIYGCLIGLVAFGLGRRSRGGSPMPVFVALVLVYAVMFFTLPFMKELGIAANLNNALSLLFLTLSMPLLASVAPQLAVRGAVFLTAGAFGAALMAAVFMGPLFNVLPHQDEVFVALPFVVNLAVLVLGVTLGPWLQGLLPQGGREAPGQHGVADETALAVVAGNPWEMLASEWGLTARETQVLELIVQGRNEPYMSDHLCISRATVKTHVNHIYKKAGVLSRQELLDRVHGEG